MKNKKLVSLFAVSVFFISSITAICWATQRGAIENTKRVVRGINNQYGDQINWRDGDDDVKLLYLAEGESYKYSTQFYKGNKYFIAAIGCDDATDLDIYLYDENGNLIDKDSSTDARPVVHVQPKWSGKFYVKVKMYDAVGGAAHAVVLTGYH